MAGPPSPEAMKARIISHMNADHSDSVALYLDHHFRTSSLVSSSARLTDISLDKLTIATSFKTYTLPLEPPMSAWSEARPRLVAMDVAAREALKRAPVSVTKYVPPSGFPAVVFAACLLGYTIFSTDSFVQEGGWAWEYLLKFLPVVGPLVQQYRLLALVLMVGIHFFEASIMVSWLRWANVPLGSSVWWAWFVSCAIEGFNSFQRLGTLVEQKQKENEKRKH